MVSRIPAHKTLRGKKVLSIRDDQAIVSCSDGSKYQSDIVVGADGAYSGVRQSPFKSLKKEGRLLASDK
jgi:2-polyprenyl-6-methoxyphenol hydroxylase-like FAD-dependent oxidoreductase